MKAFFVLFHWEFRFKGEVAKTNWSFLLKLNSSIISASFKQNPESLNIIKKYFTKFFSPVKSIKVLVLRHRHEHVKNVGKVQFFFLNDFKLLSKALNLIKKGEKRCLFNLFFIPCDASTTNLLMWNEINQNYFLRISFWFDCFEVRFVLSSTAFASSSSEELSSCNAIYFGRFCVLFWFTALKECLTNARSRDLIHATLPSSLKRPARPAICLTSISVICIWRLSLVILIRDVNTIRLILRFKPMPILHPNNKA